MTSTAADTTAITTTESTGTNGGVTKTYVTDRDPNGNITGSGGELAVRDDTTQSDLYFNRAATTGTVWDTIVTNPPTVIQITSAAQLTALATADLITVSVPTTFVIKSTIVSGVHFTTNENIRVTLDFQNTGTYVYTGTSDFIAGSGSFTAKNGTLVATSTGKLLTLAATSGLRNGAEFQDMAAGIWVVCSGRPYCFWVIPLLRTSGLRLF